MSGLRPLRGPTASHKAENSIDKIDGPRKYELARATASPAKTLANTEWIFVREETTMSRSRPVEPGESLPYNHHLHQFLTFLKCERGFADATIVNREGSLKFFFRLAGLNCRRRL